MSIAKQADKIPQRNGFVTMVHTTRKANDGGMLLQLVRQDAVPVFKANGWVEYVPQPEPFEARRVGENKVSISVEEYERLKAVQKVKTEEQAGMQEEPLEEVSEEYEPIENKPVNVPTEIKRGRGNWKK